MATTSTSIAGPKHFLAGFRDDTPFHTLSRFVGGTSDLVEGLIE
jgi:hypothetical protein